MKKKLILLFLIGLILLTISGYFILRSFPKEQQAQDDKNVFQHLNVEIHRSKTEVLQEAFGSESYWDEWSWEEDIILSQVEEVNEPLKELTLVVSKPPIWHDHILRSVINCTPQETVAVSHINPTQELEGGGFDIFDKVEAGDVFMSYCQEEECLNMGELCILMKVPQE